MFLALRGARDGIRSGPLEERLSQFLASSVTKAKQKMSIVMNPETIQRVIGS